MSHGFWRDFEVRWLDAEFRAAHERQRIALAAMAAGCEGNSEYTRTGWYAGGYHRRRWWWRPPWKVTRPWFPRAALYPTGGDEWCNPTLSLVLPLFLGHLVVRYRRGPLRSVACDECVGNSPYGACRFCGTVNCLSLLPEEG